MGRCVRGSAVDCRRAVARPDGAGDLVLAGYDLLGFRDIGRPMATPGIVTAAFVAGALGNSFGNTLITGAAVRSCT